MSLVSPGDMKRAIFAQVTANGASTVTLNIAGLEANSFVFTSLNTVGGTIAPLNQLTKTAGASGAVTFNSTAGNTSIYDVLVWI